MLRHSARVLKAGIALPISRRAPFCVSLSWCCGSMRFSAPRRSTRTVALVKVPQQRVFPVVPKGRVGRANICHGKQVEIVEVHAIANLTCKLQYLVRVGDVFALGGRRHQQMILHQPRDDTRIEYSSHAVYRTRRLSPHQLPSGRRLGLWPCHEKDRRDKSSGFGNLLTKAEQRGNSWKRSGTKKQRKLRTTNREC